MTTGEIRDLVLKRLGNIDSSDIFYDDALSWVVDGVNDVISRMSGPNPMTVSHLKKLEQRWLVEPAAGEALPRPSDCLAAFSLWRYDTASQPDPLTEERSEIAELFSPFQYENLDHSETGPARYFWRISDNIYLHPTPSADVDQWIQINGVRRFVGDNTDSQVIPLPPEWKRAIADAAAYNGAMDMGWGEDAQNYMMSLEKRILQMSGQQRLETLNDRGRRIRFRNMPTLLRRR